MADDLRERVRMERRLRGWSIRDAAAAGGTSNTTWGRLEKGEIALTPRTVRAVATAFGWPASWPDDPPTATQPAGVDVLRDLQAVLRALGSAVDLLLTDAIGDLQGADAARSELRSVMRAVQ